MAEYYPLLAKAVGSLPNSTPETRRIVYERARKALIGQLRTYHPPVPEEDIEEQSLALDRAIERVETELAAAPPAAPAPVATPTTEARPTPAPPPPPPVAPRGPSGALGVPRKPLAPLRPRVPRAPGAPLGGKPPEPLQPEPLPPEPLPSEPLPPEQKPPELKLPEPRRPQPDVARSEAPREIAGVPIPPPAPDASAEPERPGEPPPKPRLEAQRPIAPLPPVAKAPKRRMWIIPAGIAVVFALVGIAAWKLRVKPETVARNTPVVTQPQTDTGKIADRVGGTKPSGDDQAAAPEPPTAPAPSEQPSAPVQSPPQSESPAAEAPASATPPPAPTASNPEVPVAYRAALLVEAPDSPSKVQTFAGTVVWKLNNVNAGPGDSVGLSVEADVDLPDDKMKAAIIFEKNPDSSLTASHTVKVRFTVAPGSYSGEIKQINVPQMRREGNSDGEPLAGVTVPVIQNSFLVGLSPGNAETANMRLVSDLPWIDIPMLLASGKIAKLTFEKGAAGQRDIAEAMAYWQKQ